MPELDEILSRCNAYSIVSVKPTDALVLTVGNLSRDEFSFLKYELGKSVYATNVIIVKDNLLDVASMTLEEVRKWRDDLTAYIENREKHWEE